jgi:uracil-DNA glycosylase family 4
LLIESINGEYEKMSHSPNNTAAFDIDCRRCSRLATFLDGVREKHPDYHGLPVAPFGDQNAQLLIVGLAPGMHGANASGRPFTGDHAGVILYETLYRYGFSSTAVSVSADDGLTLNNCRITNAVKCLPPANKPVGSEVNECNRFLIEELSALQPGSVILALGGLSHKACVKALGGRQKDYPFGHLAEKNLDWLTLLDSYHCSRYNTQTRRLTPDMFDAVFERAQELLGKAV